METVAASNLYRKINEPQIINHKEDKQNEPPTRSINHVDNDSNKPVIYNSRNNHNWTIKMNSREKKIAILAYQVAIQHERNRVARFEQGYGLKSNESGKGMAINWATNAENNGDWFRIEEGINDAC